MARDHLTPRLALTEEAVTVLFCLMDDAYRAINPRGHRRYEPSKRLSDSEVIALALLQRLRGTESERSFLREAERFFSHLFPGVVGLWPSSLDRRVLKLRRFFEPLRRAFLGELVGDPETLIVDSTLLSVLHPRQVKRSAAGFGGAAWVRWGSFSVYGFKLHLLCATNRVPVSYELTPASTAGVRLAGELLDGAGLANGGVARRLSGDLAYRSGPLREALAEAGVALVTERAEQRGERQQVEIAFASLKRELRLAETLAVTLAGLATRIAAKVTAYTYAFLVNRLLGRPQGRIKDPWA
jgi:Transposase DDE domain